MSPVILVIDDDLAVRDSLKQVLEQTGYSVATAQDGEAGLALLQGSPCDLLILDLDLPKISGWDVIDFVTTNRPALPVIILTAMADQCEPGATAGADAVLVKPPDVAHLLATVQGLLTTSARRLKPRQRSRGVIFVPPTPPRSNYLRLAALPALLSRGVRRGKS